MSGKKPVPQNSDGRPRDLSSLLKDAPAGAWVALSRDKTRIAGIGKSIRAATYQAQLKGEQSPVLIKMPLQDEGLVAGVR